MHDYPDTKDHFLDEDTLARLFHSSRPALMIIQTKRLSRLKASGILDATALGCYDRRYLIANKAAAALLASLPPDVRAVSPIRKGMR